MILCYRLTCWANLRAPRLHPSQQSAGAGRCLGTWEEARDDVIREVQGCERYREWRPGEAPEHVRWALDAEGAADPAAAAARRRKERRSA